MTWSRERRATRPLTLPALGAPTSRAANTLQTGGVSGKDGTLEEDVVVFVAPLVVAEEEEEVAAPLWKEEML